MKPKKVLITVKTIQTFEKETDEIELITEGIMSKRRDSFLVEYEESEISGMKGTKTSLEIYDKTVDLVREGETNSHLTFELGVEHISLYGNEHGAFEVIVKPKKINIDVSENGGTVELDYFIETQNINMSENNLILTIEELD